MLIVMKHGASHEQIAAVVKVIEELGYEARPMGGRNRTAVGIVGNDGTVDPGRFVGMPGVSEAVPVSKPYKQVSREWKDEPTVVELPGGVRIGDGSVVVIAGPCAVESRDQILGIARALRDAGASALRGGAYKPRTSPYSFQGLQEEGLEYLAEAREATGLPIVTEALEPGLVDLVAQYADVLQVGARNMQNYPLLRAVGASRKPVLLKRGMSATISELLLAAEYVLAEGNPNVILCERGVRGFDPASRNVLDLTSIPVVKERSHLPIIADPSHGTGVRSSVTPMALAAVAAGADGLMIEVHPDPPSARSDGVQSLYPDQFVELMGRAEVVARAEGRSLGPVPPVKAQRAAPVHS